MKIFLYALALSLILSITQYSHAKPIFSIAPGIMYFNYEEVDLNNITLDTEIGFIPGFSVHIQDTQHSYGAHIFTGEVDYDGQTQSGTPHQTDTDEDLYYFYYRYDLVNNTNDKKFFIGLNYHQWQRFINARNGVSSLYEEYRWWHFEAGIKLEKILASQKSLIFELAGLRTFNGKIDIDLENFGFGTPTLNLGEEFGIRSLLSVELKTDSYSTSSIGVEYRYWGFGRSNTETLSNGFSTISIVEPESTTNQLRFFVNFTQSF